MYVSSDALNTKANLNVKNTTTMSKRHFTNNRNRSNIIAHDFILNSLNNKMDNSSVIRPKSLNNDHLFE